jgi:hypothetical protein
MKDIQITKKTDDLISVVFNTKTAKDKAKESKIPNTHKKGVYGVDLAKTEMSSIFIWATSHRMTIDSEVKLEISKK